MVLKNFGREDVTELSIQYISNQLYGKYNEDILRAASKYLADNQSITEGIMARCGRYGINPLSVTEIVTKHLKDLVYLSECESHNDFICRMFCLYSKEIAGRSKNLKAVLPESLYVRWVTQALLNLFVIQAVRSTNNNCIEDKLKYAPIPIDQYTLDYVKHITDPFGPRRCSCICEGFRDLEKICEIYESAALKDSNGDMVDCFLVQYLILRVKFDTMGGMFDGQ